jgi:BCCT family betaine/carnitine transporter
MSLYVVEEVRMKKINTIETRIFVPSLVFAALSIIALLCAPEKSKVVIDKVFHFLTHDLGWTFLITITAMLIISLWIAFSKLGAVKLGAAYEPKEYSDWAWTAMIFAAGMSIAVVLLGFLEPINLLSTQLMDAEPFSEQAFEYAHMYAQFFQGPIAWGVYGPASVAVAYMLYVKKGKVLRFSEACQPVLGKQTNGIIGTGIDVLVMVGMIGGVSTSLGMGTPAVTIFIEYLTGIPQSLSLTIFVLFIWAALFGTSVYLGLDKGIKRLSDINLYLMIALMVIVFISMPISEFFYTELNSIGLIIDNLGELAFGSSMLGETSFTNDWTVFYWAWWLAFMPMIALFGARISKGRTIKQMILGELVYGGGGSLLVFGLFGTYSLYLQKSASLDLISILAENGRELTLIAILETLPFSKIVIVLALVLIFVFLATTLDSTAYTLASVCTVSLTGYEQPVRWNRMLWAIILLLFSLGLVLIGGLQTIQTASILLGFPLILISVVVVSTIRKIYLQHKF